MLIIEFIANALSALSANAWASLTTNNWEDEIRNWEDIS